MSVGSTEQYINKLVQISRFLKGSTSIPELENMTAQKVHCVYKSYIDYSVSQQRAMEENDKKEKVNNNVNNNQSSGGGIPMGMGNDELEEMMEDMM